MKKIWVPIVLLLASISSPLILDSSFPSVNSVDISMSPLPEHSMCPPSLGGHIEKIDDQIFESENKEQIQVCLNKNEISVTDKYGNECGKISYTIPCLSLGADSTVCQENIDKINSYFCEEMSMFWRRKDTSELLSKAQNYAQCGTQNIPTFSSEVTTQIVQANDGIFSIRQVKHWYAGGTISDLECGVTFNLYTGECLSLNDFIDCSLDDFCVQTVDFLYNRICNSGRMSVSKEEISVRCNPSTLNIYNFYAYEREIYVPIPSASSSEADTIVCWSLEQQAPIKLFVGHTSTNG